MAQSHPTAHETKAFLSRIGIKGCLGLGVSTLALTHAWAQQAQPAAAEGKVEDVVVSAPPETPTEQQLKKVQESPVTATVVTQQQLQAAQITDLQGAQRLQPSLNIKFQNIRNIAINVRGFGAASSGATDAIFGGTPVYLNGIYQPFVGQAVFNIPDLAGVEVLKGPQATAGGQDNTGGAVNITTQLPSFTQSQNYEFQYGRFNMFQESGSLTGPIADSDWAAFRLSFFSKDQDGYLRSTTDGNLYNGQHAKGGIAQVLLTPTQDLTALLLINYSTVGQGCCISGYAGQITNYTNGAAISNSFAQRAARGNFNLPAPNTFLDTYTTNGAGWQNTSNDTYEFAAKIDYNLNGYTFQSVSAFEAYDFHPHNGYNAVPGAIYVLGTGSQIDAKAVTQELKVSTPKGSPVEVTAGAFFLWSQTIDHGLTLYGPLGGAYYGNVANSVALNGAALNFASRYAYDNPSTTEIAPYIQDVWHATSNLDITTGFRYSYNAKSSTFYQYQLNTPPLDSLSPADQATAQALRNSSLGVGRNWYAETHQGLISYLANATYKFTPDVFGYVTVSQGGRAGGPNPASGNIPASVPTTVLAERLQNFELGAKSSWFDQKLTANVALFYIVDHNYITYQASQISGTTQAYLANAKRANNRGVEVDLRAQPVDGLSVYGSLTFNDSYFGSFSNAACPLEITGQTNCNLTGKPLSNTPRWTFVTGGEYTHSIGNLLQPYGIDKELLAYAGADFTWQSEFFSDYTDSVYTIIHPYGLLNLHAGVKFADSSYDVVVWAHNALDKHYYTQIAAPTSGGLITATVGDPLEVGATIRAKF